ncbi:MAG: SCO6880 family protein, partial [Nocardioides sp.]
MSVYGASGTRDRQGWLFGLTGPQFFLVMAAGFPTWMAMAISQWLALALLVPVWVLVGLLICVPIRGWSAFQWIGVLLRHLTGAAFGWSRFQSKAAAGDLDLGDG